MIGALSSSTLTRTIAQRIDTATLAVSGSALTLLLLGALHALSPEFDPSWRVVSEYANGRFGWVLSLMFLCWAVATWALASLVRPHLQTRAGRAGAFVLYAAAVGEALASVFDINSPMHDAAGLLGAAGLPVAAMLITRSLCSTKPALRNNKPLIASTHLTWIAVVLTILGVVTLFFTFTHAGGHVPADGSTLPIDTVLPSGTIAFVGYANRLMVVANCLWAVMLTYALARRTP